VDKQSISQIWQEQKLLNKVLRLLKKWHKDNPDYGKSAAWQRKEGKNPSGGLNRKV